MILSLLQYATSGFWVFIGVATLVTIVLHYCVNGIVLLVRAVMK